MTDSPLLRIALALEKIALLLEQNHQLDQHAGPADSQQAGGKARSEKAKRGPNGRFLPSSRSSTLVQLDKKNEVSALIATYVRAWQSRYGTKARPDVGGKSQGILKRLLKEVSVSDGVLLLQVFCQMEDKWFVEKRHDLGTFEQNLNKVSLALDKGHEQTAVNWEKIFGGDDGKGLLSKTDGQGNENLGGKELPAGKVKSLLEKLPTPL